MQRCRFCNAELPEQAGFCGNCGRSQTLSGIQSDAGLPPAIDIQSPHTPTFISDPLLPTSFSERSKHMQRCQFCNAELPEQADFCGNCGRSHTLPGIQSPATPTFISDASLPTVLRQGSQPDAPTFISDASLPTVLRQGSQQEYDSTEWGWTNDQDVQNRQLPDNPQTGESTTLRVDPFLPGIPPGPNTPLVGSTPMVQGTPPVGGVPSVQGTPSPLNNPPPAASNTLPAQGFGHGAAPSAPSPSMPPSALPQSQPGWRPVEKPATISPQQRPKKARPNFKETTEKIIAYPQTLFHAKNIKVLLLLGALFIILGGSAVFALDEASEQGIATGFLGFDEPFERQLAEPFTHTQAHALATGTAQAAAALQHPYPPGGTLLYNNTLSSNSTTFPWMPGYQISGANCSFMNGALHVVESNPHHFYYCVANKTNFSNFKFQAQMTILKGNAGGIIFRDQGPENYYFRLYYFSIGQDGSYSLQRYVHAPANSFSQLVHDQSPFIKTGLGQTNLIAVVAHGNTIDLYVNQQYLASVTDSTYTQGQIGLAAQSEGDPTEVAFSNAQVYTLS
jgi:ribosomal protein L40E